MHGLVVGFLKPFRGARARQSENFKLRTRCRFPFRFFKNPKVTYIPYSTNKIQRIFTNALKCLMETGQSLVLHVRSILDRVAKNRVEGKCCIKLSTQIMFVRAKHLKFL